MRKREKNADEISSNRRTKKPLFYVAAGAIFLFAFISLGAHAISGPAQVDTSILLSIPPARTQAGVLSAYLASGAVAEDQSPDLLFVGSGSLLAAVPPGNVSPTVLGAIMGGSSLDTRSSRETTHYVIEEGDTIAGVAEKFGISENTILWSNDLSSSATLKPGEELVILPVSGTLHLVRPGDTVSEIAVWYKGEAQEIFRFNGVETAEEIFVGDILIIPNGIKPAQLPNSRLTPVANSYFIYPVPRSYKITQGLHPFNAIDFANGSCGGPVYAAAGGSAQVVGYNNGLGNHVRILHPNGVVTAYAHLSSNAVNTGAKVSQGQIIGYIGHTGHTIPAGPAGCHLHFEVRGATNPFR